MKAKIGTKNISINDAAIKGTKDKEAFVKEQAAFLKLTEEETAKLATAVDLSLGIVQETSKTKKEPTVK